MNFLFESETQKQEFKQSKVKKKMSKAQVQMAIIKKKQCDAKALLIVEQLLEPIVEPQWLLENLQYINRNHMEDVIEERAITKLCGYVLCNNPLTVVVTQQYHISMKSNKVYDVTRRKNFCSSCCYGACYYLLEQMLTSPLWLRDKEEIPIFQILSTTENSSKSMHGDEIHVSGLENLLDKDTDEFESSTKNEKHKKDTNNIDKSAECKQIKEHLQKDIDNKHTTILDHQISIKNTYIQNVEKYENNIHNGFLHQEIQSVDNTVISNQNEENDEENKTESDKLNEIDQKVHNVSVEEKQNLTFESKENGKIIKNTTEKIQEMYKNENDSQSIITQTMTNYNIDGINNEKNKNEGHNKERTKNKCTKGEKQTKRRTNSDIKFGTVAIRVEQSVKEWVTEDTLCFLQGDSDTRHQLMESMVQREKYEQLCKKLNRIQLESEKEDREDLENTSLKPLPHYIALREEANKMELKVRAFYEGKTVIDSSGRATDTSDNNEFDPILPLVDIHAPKVLRRKIFLDKLHKTLPDLLRMLIGNIQNYAMRDYIHNNHGLIKALVNTFSLSASNIVFKTAEWTLIGLLIIRMLSIVDPKLKSLLATKQASMYISMVLMAYKLDSNYLDRFIIEICNNPNIFEIK